jgi:hypothetical protein
MRHSITHPVGIADIRMTRSRQPTSISEIIDASSTGCMDLSILLIFNGRDD